MSQPEQSGWQLLTVWYGFIWYYGNQHSIGYIALKGKFNSVNYTQNNSCETHVDVNVVLAPL